MIQYEDQLEINSARMESEFSLAKEKCAECYETPGNSRALHLILPNGERLFFQYFSLPRGCCSADGSIITLVFSGEKVVLKGRNLLSLYKAISQQRVSEISCIEERYIEAEFEIEEDKKTLITSISVLPS